MSLIKLASHSSQRQPGRFNLSRGLKHLDLLFISRRMLLKISNRKSSNKLFKDRPSVVQSLKREISQARSYLGQARTFTKTQLSSLNQTKPQRTTNQRSMSASVPLLQKVMNLKNHLYHHLVLSGSRTWLES